ncbi:MAG: alpha/beta hydrolase, partial [Spirochaetes bacterium]|nr:alpha/beta hydrolase [Spirochaetota bacterium]
MRKIKIYGKSPYSIALIHGGPGAPGSLTPLAEELSSFHGILELFQSEDSLEGQVHELKSLLEKHGDHPITLVGHSW